MNFDRRKLFIGPMDFFSIPLPGAPLKQWIQALLNAESLAVVQPHAPTMSTGPPEFGHVPESVVSHSVSSQAKHAI